MLKKRPQQRCFPVEIVTFLRTPILKNIWERLFLCFRILKKMRKMKNDKSKAQKNRKSLGKIISSFLISEFFIFSYRQNRKVGFKNLGKKFPRFPSFWPGPFDTVNHKILFSKLEYYGIKGKSKHWPGYFTYNRQQFSSIDGQNSGLNLISHGVPQSSVLGPLLFIIFINNLHYAATHSKVRHFADDTNLLFANKSRKKIYKLINHDLAFINKWLRANKISLNTSKQK